MSLSRGRDPRPAAGLVAGDRAWRASAAVALPAGERIAVIGCGSSWHAAKALAALRERSGAGETDAFAASEARPRSRLRPRRRDLALRGRRPRSGARSSGRRRHRRPSPWSATRYSPVAADCDLVDRPELRRRPLGGPDALRHHGRLLCAGGARPGGRRPARRRGACAGRAASGGRRGDRSRRRPRPRVAGRPRGRRSAGAARDRSDLWRSPIRRWSTATARSRRRAPARSSGSSIRPPAGWSTRSQPPERPCSARARSAGGADPDPAPRASRSPSSAGSTPTGPRTSSAPSSWT